MSAKSEVVQHIQPTNALFRYAVSLLFSGIVLSCGFAADEVYGPSLRTDGPFAAHLQRKFRSQEGLPSNWIYDVLQTRDGYVWIATHNGLARYDGLRFRVFNRSNTPQLPANDVRALFESRDGILWIGTVGGLARFQSGQPGTFQEFKDFAGNSIHAFCEDRDSGLWIGTREKTWKRTPGGDFDLMTELPTDVKAICEDQAGRIWFGSDGGLYVLGATLERINHPSLPMRVESDGGISSAGVNALLADNEGGVWVGANRGLLYRKNGRFVSRGEELGTQQIYGLLQTRSGTLYAAARHGLQRSVDGGPFQELPDAHPWCLAEDRDGGLWVGHGVNLGLHLYRNRKIRSILTEHRVFCLHEDAAGEMWFGSDSGLHRLQDGLIIDYGTDDGLPDKRIQSIAQASEGGFWIGTRKGVSRWTGSEFSTLEQPAKLTELNIASLFESSSGALWLALSSRGAYVLKDGALSKLPELDHGRVSWFYEDVPGELWIGNEYGLFRYRDGEIRQVKDAAFERLNNSHFICHYVGKDGTLWLGTAGGIVRYRSGRFDAITSEDGLAADFIDRLTEDHQGNLWLGGRDGFFYVEISALDQLVDNQIDGVISQRLEQSEGINISSYHPKGCFASDGTTWIAAAQGVIRLSPEQLPKNSQVLLVHIEQVRLDGQTICTDEDCEWLSGHHRLAIDFAAPTFTNPTNVRVKYRLDGHDDDWVSAGDERVAYYTDLLPGAYTFRVSAGIGQADSLDSAKTLSFTVNPRWWETPWSRATAVFSLIGLTLSSTWGYTRRVRKRNTILRREVSQRKLAQEDLQRSETRFRDLAESTHAIPFEADASSLRFAYVGQQAKETLGYSTKDWLIDGFWIEHLHADDRLKSIEFLQGAVAKGGSHQFDCRMIAADGKTVWLHNVLHVRESDGVPKRLIGFMIDFSQRREAEERARDYLQQLARVNRASSMGEMATSIAHEVNQPLFAIVSNAQTAERLLDREPPDIQEVREALSDIAGDGNRAAKFIKNIRSLVRKEQPPVQRLDLNQVARDALEFVRPELRERGLSLRVELAHSLPPVKGNPIELQQVILNLIINGAQAMDNNRNGQRELLITSSARDGFAQLSVMDEGSGIDQTTMDRLFEPFFTTKPHGTGMGLAINRTIINAHGGRIWATRNDEHGATFHLQLPVIEQAAAQSGQSP